MFEQKPITKSGSANNFLRRRSSVKISTHKTTIAWIFGIYLLKDIGEVGIKRKSHKTPKSVCLIGGAA